ncbi:MAG: hypothetical protein ACRC8S_12525 [Fimbriiglobus sp.]
MRNNLFIGLAVGMLLLVVFGVTIISQYTGAPVENDQKNSNAVMITGPALSFATTEMKFDPAAQEGDWHKRYFQALYEVNDQLQRVNFWFKNPHPLPVTVTVRGRSCTSCTSASIVVIPADQLSKFLAPSAAHSTFTPFGLPDLATPLHYLALQNQFQWQTLDFDRPEASVTIPAATDPNNPTWGVFQMIVKLSGMGDKNLKAAIGMNIGNLPTETLAFTTIVAGVAEFEIHPRKIEIGEFSESSTSRNYDILVWSATREFAELPAPSTNINIKDAFVELGTPVPLTDAERQALFLDRLSANTLTRVKAAYRFPVTVHRKAKENAVSLDIGPFERQVGFASSNHSTALTITANVTGVVALVDGSVIDLGEFNTKAGIEKSVNIVSDRGDLELNVANDELFPKYLKATLSAPRIENTRKYWTLKVSIAPEACLEDLSAKSFVVLKGLAGKDNVKVRFPVKGRGSPRGR